MAEAEPKVEEKDDSAVKVYARVRQILPWENEKLGIKWTKDSITNYGLNNASKEYKFTQALAPEMDNDEAFDIVIKPLIDRVLDGYNSLVIAYGQTGAGKTYTLLGKPKLGVTGMLTRSLVEFLENKDVKEIRLRAMEAYGIKPAKIELFDLLGKDNHTGDWSAKVGNSRSQIESDQTTTELIATKEDCFKVIERAQQSSHFAPTGKNPESSRGHIVFVIDVKGENENNEEISSSMVFADLAGSEGDSALTDEFIASVTQETLLARKLEGGVINVGLSELQLVFRDLMKKGTLSKSTGTGLIRMIKPYINSNTFISVVFCLSPSFVNCASTEATLKFAAQACQLKTAPAKAKKRINYENMSNRLREELSAQTLLVEKLQQCIAQTLDAEASSVLIQKIEELELSDLFDIKDNPGLQLKSVPDDAEFVKKKSKSRKHSKQRVTPRLNRDKSEAMLAVESAEAEENSWRVSRNNKKHRRMFSKHIEANQLEEIAAMPLFEVNRNDQKVVEELFEEAAENEHTRNWVAVMAQSLYRSRQSVGNRLSAWGGSIEKFFSRIARSLWKKKKQPDNDSDDNDFTERKQAVDMTSDDEILELPVSGAQPVEHPHSLAFNLLNDSGGAMDSAGLLPELDTIRYNAMINELPMENSDKVLDRVNTEDVIRLNAME